MPLQMSDGGLAELAREIESAGGALIGAYRDPLNGRPLLLASLPLTAVEPTPFQRDLSPTHTKRLAQRIDETGVFLDPLIVVRGTQGKFYTPNGRHRLAAARMLGMQQIIALISQNDDLAYRILALNTEKAHNLKDKSLEVVRMARTLAKLLPRRKESECRAEFEAPELLTLGMIYEKNPRFGGGAYSAFLKKIDRFSERTLPVSLRERASYAARIEQIEVRVQRIVNSLHSRGLKSPYLRNYVVARINPVRFIKPKKGATAPVMQMNAALTRMAAAAAKFDVGSVSMSDLGWMTAGAEAED
jgi:ParB family chromosome partitioning protein